MEVLMFGIADNFSLFEVRNSSSSPFIKGIATPAAADRGPNTREVLSPTPAGRIFFNLGTRYVHHFDDFAGKHHFFGEKAVSEPTYLEKR